MNVVMRAHFITTSVTIALLPLIYRPGIQQISNLPKETFLAVGVVATLAAFILSAVFDGEQQRLRIPRWSTSIIVSIIVYAWLSVIWAENKPLACLFAFQWTVPVLLFLVVATSQPSLEEVVLLLASICVGASLNSALALYQHWTDSAPFYHFASPGGTYLNKNFAAQVSVSGLPLAMLGYIYFKSAKFYVLSGICALTLSLHIIHTFSRSAWIAASAVVLLIVLFICLKRRWWKGLLAFGLAKTSTAIVLVLLFFVGLNFSEEGYEPIHEGLTARLSSLSEVLRISETLDVDFSVRDADTGTITGRLKKWRNSIPMILDNSVLGVAEGNFQVKFPLYANSVYRTGFSTEHQYLRYLHNEYLEFIAEYGFFGLLAGTALIAFIASRLLVSLRARDFGDGCSFALFAAQLTIVALLITALFSSPFFWPTQKTYFLSSLAVISAIRYSSGWSVSYRTKGFHVAAVAIIGVLILYCSLGRYYFQSRAESLYFQGMSSIRRGEYLDAKASLSDAIGYRPNYQEALMTYGATLFQLGELEHSISIFERLLKLYPHDYRVLSNISSAHVRNGQNDKALIYLGEILRVDPVDRAASTQAASIHYFDGNYSDAETYLLPYAYGPESSPHAFLALSENSRASGDFGKCIYWLKEGLKHHPGAEELSEKLKSYRSGSSL